MFACVCIVYKVLHIVEKYDQIGMPVINEIKMANEWPEWKKTRKPTSKCLGSGTQTHTHTHKMKYYQQHKSGNRNKTSISMSMKKKGKAKEKERQNEK